MILFACLLPLITADEPVRWYGELTITQITADTTESCDLWSKCDLRWLIGDDTPCFYGICPRFLSSAVVDDTHSHSWSVDKTYGTYSAIDDAVEIQLEVI